ncbi:MAG: family 20 glycosylhydrolase, partial [Bacteroidales bacterium]|nr:family 20 glycosylhydrolase [Bacteroidales bacterium]
MKRLTLLLSLVLLGACCAEKPAPDLVIVPNPVSMVGGGKGVVLKEGEAPVVKTRINKKLAEEEYVLDTRCGKVKITAGSEAGIFLGRQTLLQIVSQVRAAGADRIPGVLIKDKPAFAYRGAHLDCSRHFFTVDEVKQYIDILAMHKINVFHWHLTDDQGWRAEIKSYPKLTEVGSVRPETIIGHQRDKDKKFDGTPH